MLNLMESDHNIKDLGGVTVLLVEDNLVNVFVAKKFIEKWNGRVIVAENGVKAIEMVIEAKPDIILMDLHMPQMDGFEATVKIREFDKEIPIIAVSASAAFHTQSKTQEAGMNDYLSKPFNANELYDAVKRHLAHS